MNLQLPIVAGDAVYSDSVIQSGYGDGVIFSVPKINQPETFRERIHNVHGFEDLDMNLAAPLGYDATMIMLNAIKQHGTDKQEVIDYLSLTSYHGVSNPLIEFDENGDLKSGQFEFLVIQNRSTVAYKR